MILGINPVKGGIPASDNKFSIMIIDNEAGQFAIGLNWFVVSLYDNSIIMKMDVVIIE